MQIEVRPATSEEMDDVRKIAADTNLLPPDFIPQKYIDGITHDMTLCAFVDGKVATSYAAWPFYMRFNGIDAPVAGVSIVGTLPVFRRMGFLRKVHTRHFQLLHEKGERPISILFASQAPIYQRYGYAVVSTQNSYQIEPRHIQFRQQKHLNSTGKLIQLHDKGTETLDRIYRQFSERRTGYLIRDNFKWNTGVLNPPSDPCTVHDRIVYEENGVPMGYVVYTAGLHFTDRGIAQKITIKDMAWLSISAYYGIWNYLTKMDLAHSINWMQVPPDDPMPHLILEPATLNIKSTRGLLARIIDLEKAIPVRGYSEDGELIFEVVDDDMCPWNNGTWHMKIRDGKGSIEKTEITPEVSVTINSFAKIVFGHISATRAMRMGLLDSINKEVLHKYDRLLRTDYMPFCCDII
jgi:predicted acetyltransferase